MGKVVYNACHGGFGLSRKAMLRYAELKGIQIYPEPSGFMDLVTYYLQPPSGDGPLDAIRESLRDHGIERDDPALVQVVEELGDAADDRFASLEIAEVPPGVAYRIDEYDGMESVMTVNDYGWKIARE